MKRTILLMATMSLTLLVVGGVAYALPVQCDGDGDQNLAEGICEGTLAADNITGTSGDDEIHAKAGDDTVDALGGNDTVRGGGENDVLHGRNGDDELSGDGANVASRDGQDYIYGEGGEDTLDGEGGVNHYFGEPGDDTIDAEFSFSPEESPNAVDGEIIHGGRGDDHIFAADELVDHIDCGAGTDTVTADELTIDEVAANCENLN